MHDGICGVILIYKFLKYQHKKRDKGEDKLLFLSALVLFWFSIFKSYVMQENRDNVERQHEPPGCEAAAVARQQSPQHKMLGVLSKHEIK